MLTHCGLLTPYGDIYRSESTLVHVPACYLTAPSDYLDHCWLKWFPRKCSWYQFLRGVGKLYFQNYCHISQWPRRWFKHEFRVYDEIFYRSRPYGGQRRTNRANKPLLIDGMNFVMSLLSRIVNLNRFIHIPYGNDIGLNVRNKPACVSQMLHLSILSSGDRYLTSSTYPRMS